MPHFMNYVLESIKKYSSHTFFQELVGTPEIPDWSPISYETYLRDLEKAAFFWHIQLANHNIQSNDVVGLWLTGSKYSDLVHLYGLSWAGVIPQVFSNHMSVPGVGTIKGLLSVSNAKALVYDPCYSTDVGEVTWPTLLIPPLESLNAPQHSLPPLPEVDDRDVAIYFHTSGTTSGNPKPVPETHAWLRSEAQVQWPGIWQARFKKSLTINNIGSFAVVGSATAVNYLSWGGQCLVQTSKPNFDAVEFIAMVTKTGLNALFLHAPRLSKLIKMAREDRGVLKALLSIEQICYTGAALYPEEEGWIIENRLPVTAMYATTETAICMVSDLHRPEMLPSMRVIPGNFCKLIPASGIKKVDLDGISERKMSGGKLFDFFVPADAGNCPHLSITNRPDGHITGDLFEETAPGYYSFRGRNDDWIRVGKDMVFCDTKSIEDHLLLTSADLVQNCVVVGHYQPCIVIFVEPIIPRQDLNAANIIKTDIIARMSSFNAGLFEHEKLRDPCQIVVVTPGALPRTQEKGNIRRKAVEEEFAEILKGIYAKMRGC